MIDVRHFYTYFVPGLLGISFSETMFSLMSVWTGGSAFFRDAQYVSLATLLPFLMLTLVTWMENDIK